jgi:hypothetical protein
MHTPSVAIATSRALRQRAPIDPGFPAVRNAAATSSEIAGKMGEEMNASLA